MTREAILSPLTIRLANTDPATSGPLDASSGDRLFKLDQQLPTNFRSHLHAVISGFYWFYWRTAEHSLDLDRIRSWYEASYSLLVHEEIHRDFLLALSDRNTEDSRLDELEALTIHLYKRVLGRSIPAVQTKFTLDDRLPKVDIETGGSISDLEQKFDIVARKALKSPDSVFEGTIAGSNSSQGLAQFKVARLDPGNFVINGTASGEKVFSIAARGAIEFKGKRSNKGGPSRFYALLFPKGFIEEYGVVRADKSHQPNFYRKIEILRDLEKLFFVHFEGVRKKKSLRKSMVEN